MNTFAAWDPTNRRFAPVVVCPHPGCGADLAGNGEQAGLGWCDACKRPVEYVRIEDGPGLIRAARRADATFCTVTGRPWTRRSPLDWPCVGGRPEGNNAQEDLAGRVFGNPGPHSHVVLRPGWTARVFDELDPVRSLAVSRGRIVATSLTGGVGVLDPRTGEMQGRALLWPFEVLDPYDELRRVEFPSALSGTRIAVVTPSCAALVELGGLLNTGRADAGEGVRVEPTRGSRFLAAPLPVEVGERHAFCLVEGTHVRDPAPRLRFVAADGKELGDIVAEDLARPPVYDHERGQVVWVDIAGALCVMDLTGTWPPPQTCLYPSSVLSLMPPLNPTFVLAADGGGGLDAWVVFPHAEHKAICVARAPLSRQLAHPNEPWAWTITDTGCQAEVRGLAIANGARSYGQRAGDLGAFTSDKGLFIFAKSGAQTVRRHPFPDPCFDPPVVGGAGVFARSGESLAHDVRGSGWYEIHAADHLALDLPLAAGAQGIALFGRQVLLGAGAGVRSVDIGVERFQRTEGA